MRPAERAVQAAERCLKQLICFGHGSPDRIRGVS